MLPFALLVADRGRARVTIVLTCLALFSGVQACKKVEQGNSPDAYVENGTIWAYGQVKLTDLDVPSIVMLDRGTTDQTLNIEKNEFHMFGLVKTEAGGTAERSLAYVDYHPQGRLALSYAYDLEFSPRAAQGYGVDIYVLMKKPGYTYRAQRLYLGTATFAEGESKSEVALHPSLRVSQVAEGPGAGAWGLHYADIKNFVIRPWGAMCNGRVGQVPGQIPGQYPGQNPNQNPNQSNVNCRPLPQEIDLCEGDPTKENCRPKTPFVQAAELAPVLVAQDEEITVRLEESRVYTMDLGTQRAKFVFVSQQNTVKDGMQNSQQCSEILFATTETDAGVLNAACEVKMAPADPVENQLTCGLTVQFLNAETYLEKICNVSVHFRTGDAWEHQQIQVLKR